VNPAIDAQTLVDLLIAQLDEAYVFPDRSARAAELLRARLEQGSYGDELGPDLCERISADLLAASEDKHLRLLWHESAAASRDEAELVAALREQFRFENHGVRKIERLPGNVGLVELTLIPELAEGGATLAAALQLMQHTHALIFDLRPTRGGSPDGVAFLASYLFPDGDIHLSDILDGPQGTPRQYWTAPYLPGPRYLDRPAYVLTSAATFSGGEALAYDLQAHARATIIGEPTRGGAHPSQVVSLAEHIELRLPIARTISPITGSNWEGLGVQPDLPTAAAAALDVAYRTALETIAENTHLPDQSRLEARQQLGHWRSPTPSSQPGR